MKIENQKHNTMADVRSLASELDKTRLEQCIEQSLTNQPNPCFYQVFSEESEEVVNVLTKAAYIRGRVDKGESINQAMRELGKRIRSIQGEF